MVTDGSIGGPLMEFTDMSHSLGADMLYAGDPAIRGFSSVSIDSRTVTEGTLFFAIPGTACDGHSFVEAAFKNGAAAAMIERRHSLTDDLIRLAKKMGKSLIAVDNTLKGLQNTAGLYLKKFPELLKIGITGSSGKTTTKEIAAAIIGIEKNIVINPGNYNSETGLPLSVFGVRPGHEVGIFEMGMNHREEILNLSALFFPDIALITNVGSAHIGILGSIEAIAEEKKNIFAQFDGNGIALIPDDSPFRDMLAAGVRGRVSWYGEHTFAEWGGARSLGLEGSEIIWAGQRIRFALPGRHNLANAVAAIAIARELHISNEAIRQGLESIKPLSGRGEILYGRVAVINDSYNANLESLERALEFCENLDWPGRRVYVIGDMLELGDHSRQAHESAGRLLLNSKADKVFLYGNECSAAAGILKDADVSFTHTCDMDELSGALDTYVRGGDMVLLKGSRGCALERLCPILLEGAA